MTHTKSMERFLKPTAILDYKDAGMRKLVEKHGWLDLDSTGKILHIYNFVRDEIAFGYNEDDALPASAVLADGYGQCNTKGVLFMALLRAAGIPCRMHGFTIDKILQKGAMKGFYYRLSPREILHSWVEVYVEGQDRWINMEGFILDLPYLNKLQRKFADCTGSFCGYGVAVADFRNPPVQWDGNDTYIQKEGIVRDFGVFDGPDELFAAQRQELGPVKSRLFRYLIRHLMNRNVRRIRNG
jgi:hypothetical protein